MSGGPRYPTERVIQYCYRNWPDRRQRDGLVAADLGCGNGINAEFLCREGFSVIVCDLSPEAVAATSLRLRSAACYSFAMTAALENLPLEDRSVDIAICVRVLECMTFSAAKSAVSETARILRPEGHALFLFTAPADMRLGRDSPLRATEAAEVHDLFDGLFGQVNVDTQEVTYFNRTAAHREWLVTVRK